MFCMKFGKIFILSCGICELGFFGLLKVFLDYNLKNKGYKVLFNLKGEVIIFWYISKKRINVIICEEVEVLWKEDLLGWKCLWIGN